MQASLLTGLQAIGFFMVAPWPIVQGCGDDKGEGRDSGKFSRCEQAESVKALISAHLTIFFG